MSDFEHRLVRVRSPIVEAGLQAHLGRQLRRIYDRALSEPVPDRFAALIEALGDRRPGRVQPRTKTGFFSRLGDDAR